MKKISFFIFHFIVSLTAYTQNPPAFTIAPGGQSKISTYDISRDGNWLAAGEDDGTVTIWKLKPLTKVNTIPTSPNIKKILFSPDGIKIIILAGIGNVYIFDAKKNDFVSNPVSFRQKEYNRTSGNSNPWIFDFCISPDSKIALFSCNREKLEFINLSTGEQGFFMEGLVLSELRFLRFSGDGNSVIFFSPATGLVQKKWRTGSDLMHYMVGNGQSAGDNAVFAVSPSGKYVASGLYNGTIIIWNARSGEEVASFPSTDARDNADLAPHIGAISFSHDDSILAAQLSDRTTRTYDVKEKRQLLAFKNAGNNNRNKTGDNGPAFSADDKYVIINNATSLNFYTSPSALSYPDNNTTGNVVTKTEISNNTSTSQTQLKKGSIQKPQLVVPYGHQQAIESYFFSASNNLLVTSDQAQTILWDVKSGKPLRYFDGHNPQLSRDEKMVFTVDKNIVKVWNILSGELIQKLVNQYPVVKLQLHPSLNQLITVLNTNGKYEIGHSKILICWDYLQAKQLHRFVQDITRQEMLSNQCAACDNNIDCPIYDGGYDETGTFILTVYNTVIKTYQTDNFTPSKTYCLNGQLDPEASISLLAGHIIEKKSPQQEIVSYFNESGRQLARLPYKKPPSDLLSSNLFASDKKEESSVSPDKNFISFYSPGKLRIVNLPANKESFFNLGANRVYFNTKARKLLAQLAGEEPVSIDLATNEIVKSPVFTDTIGWPPYLLLVKNPDGSASSAKKMFTDTISNLLRKNIPDSINKKLPFDLTSIMEKTLSEMGNSVASFYLRNGEIQSIVTGRTISKIESPVVPVSEIQLSRNGEVVSFSHKTMKSFYSIPEAKMLSKIEQPISTKTYLLPDNKTCLFTQTTDRPKHYRYDYISEKLEIVKELDNELISDIVFSDDTSYCTLITRDKKIRWYLRNNHFVPESNSIKAPVEIAINQGKGMIRWTENLITYMPLSGNVTADNYEIEDIQHNKFTKVLLSPKEDFLLVQTSKNTVELHALKNKKLLFSMKLGNDPEADVIANFGALYDKMLTEGFTRDVVLNQKKLQADFNQDGSSLLVWRGDTALIVDCADGRIKKKFAVKGIVSTLNFARDLLVSYLNGQLLFYRVSTGMEWFTMVPFFDQNVAFVLPDGVYYGSKEITQKLGYVAGLQALSYKQFDLAKARPDKVLKTLGSHNNPLIEALAAMYEKRMERMSNLSPESSDPANIPSAAILNAQEIPAEVSNQSIPLKLRLSDSQSTLAFLRISINGVPLYGSGLAITGKKALVFDTVVQVRLSEEKNIVEVSTVNSKHAESYKATLYITFSPIVKPVPNVYFIGIAVDRYNEPDKNLEYCVKDIEDIKNSLQSLYGKRLIGSILTNNEVTKINIDKLGDKLSKATEDDIIIMCYSGHGVIDTKKGESFFGTTTMAFDNPSENGLSFETLERLVSKSPSRKRLLLLDACHTGELDPEAFGKSGKRSSAVGSPELFESMLKYFAETGPVDGSFIIAASQGLKEAYMSSDLQNSTMTYCVLQGLNKGVADINSDQEITVTELKNYVLAAVPKIHKDQSPVSRRENDMYDWKLTTKKGTVNESVKKPPQYLKISGRY